MTVISFGSKPGHVAATPSATISKSVQIAIGIQKGRTRATAVGFRRRCFGLKLRSSGAQNVFIDRLGNAVVREVADYAIADCLEFGRCRSHRH